MEAVNEGDINRIIIICEMCSHFSRDREGIMSCHGFTGWWSCGEWRWNESSIPGDCPMKNELWAAKMLREL